MFFKLFDKQPIIDPVSSEWIFSAYGWALQNFDVDLFYSDTVLVSNLNRFRYRGHCVVHTALQMSLSQTANV